MTIRSSARATATDPRLAAGWLDTVRSSATAMLIARLAALLAVYVMLDWWVEVIAGLPAAAYNRPSISVELVLRLFRPRLLPSYALSLVLLAALVSLAVLRRPRLLVSWSELGGGRVLRALAGVAGLILAWVCSTYDYNLFFDQAHLLDRLALIAFAALLLWRPVFAGPFALLAAAILWQFHYPIGPYSFAEQFLLIRLLLLVFAFLLVRAVWSAPVAADVVFLILTLIAASYFVGGIGKLRLAWFSHGHVALLLPATYANGWLGFLAPETIGSITTALERVDPVLVGTTLLVECGAVLALLHRRVLLASVSAWIAFHLGILAVTGIFFWKWVLLELVLLWLLLRDRASPAFDVFHLRHRLLSLALIAGGVYWFAPVNLSWYNAAAGYTYRFEGIGANGERFALPPAFFAPYDYQFTQGGFAYVSEHRQLPVMWGATWDLVTARRLADARAATEVERLEQERGEVYRDGARMAVLDEFLTTFVGNFNRRLSKTTPLSLLRAPPQLWTVRGAGAFAGDQPIRRIEIRQLTSFFDGERYIEMRSRPVHAVDIGIPDRESR